MRNSASEKYEIIRLVESSCIISHMGFSPDRLQNLCAAQGQLAQHPMTRASGLWTLISTRQGAWHKPHKLIFLPAQSPGG